MMEAVRTSETSVDNNLTRQYNPEDSSEQEQLRFSNSVAENLKKNVTSQQLLIVLHLRIAGKLESDM
jgi:hypothetical protein